MRASEGRTRELSRTRGSRRGDGPWLRYEQTAAAWTARSTVDGRRANKVAWTPSSAYNTHSWPAPAVRGVRAQ